jgi:hypothetical protein
MLVMILVMRSSPFASLTKIQAQKKRRSEIAPSRIPWVDRELQKPCDVDVFEERLSRVPMRRSPLIRALMFMQWPCQFCDYRKRC